VANGGAPAGRRVAGRRAALAGVAALVLASLVLAGCTDGADAPSGSSSTAAPGGSGAGSGAGAASAVPSAFPSLVVPPPPAAATASGRLAGLTPDSVARLEVVSVRAGTTGTVAHFRLSTASPGRLSASRQDLSGTTRIDGVGGVTLVAPQAKSRYSVVRLADRGLCACSNLPGEFTSEPAALYAAFAPLPAAVDEVAVVVPGFPPVTVAVSRL
jgi:hypothetical protein